MKNFLTLLLLTLVLPLTVQASTVVPVGSKVFVAPMTNGLEQFVKAEMLKQKVPVTIVQSERRAQYILTGTSIDKGNNKKWYHFVTGTAGATDSMQASLSLVKRSDKSLVWANNTGDRSFFFGILRRGGERKIAQRIVKKFKREIFRKRKK